MNRRERLLQIEKAREAVTTLRDHAREHGMDHFKRDPLITAIHGALDGFLSALMPIEPKTAPVQRYGRIPWAVHMKAYEGYVREHGPQQALIEGDCRGGFGVEELDRWAPGWREDVNGWNKLLADQKALEVRLEETDQLVAEMLKACRAAKHGAYLDDNVLGRHASTTISCEALQEVVAVIEKAEEHVKRSQ